MKNYLIAGALVFAGLSSLSGQTVSIWEEDFEGATPGDTSGNNQTLAGTVVQTANALNSEVIDLTDPANSAVAAAFTVASGNVIVLTDNGNAFAALRPSTNPINGFGTVLATDTYTFSFDVYIPGATDLAVPIGDIVPRLEQAGTAGNGPNISSETVSAVGVHQVVYTGLVSDIINPNSPTQANTARPFVGFNQQTSTNTTVTADFIYVDNISFTVTPAAAVSPVIKEFAMGLSGSDTDETEAYLFTSGDNTQAGVYTTTSREFYYDVDGVNQITLNSDEPGFVPQVFPITSPATGVITPVIPTTAGVYTYTLDATDGSETVMSDPIVVSVDQPYSIVQAETNGGGSQITRASTLRINLDLRGDHDTATVLDPLAGTFSIPGFTDIDIETVAGDTLENDLGDASSEFSANFTGLTVNYNVQSIIDEFELENPVTYPVVLTIDYTATNQSGAATPSISVTIDDSNIFAEIDPANFVGDSSTIPNTYTDLFTQATLVDTPVANTNPTATFATAVSGDFRLGTNNESFGSGFKGNDATISLWVEIPASPTGNLIFDAGGTGFPGTTLGYDGGNLLGLLQQSTGDASTISTPISAGWHHIVLLLDLDPGQLTVHVDGGAAITGPATSTPVTNWGGGSASTVIFGSVGNGYSGDASNFLPSSAGLNGNFGHIRGYTGLLDISAIQALTAEFAGSAPPAPILVNSISYDGSDVVINYSTSFSELGFEGVDIYYSTNLVDWTADVFVSTVGNNLEITRPSGDATRYYILVQPGQTPTFGNFPSPPNTDGTP